jgi:hypothetical protein
MMRTFTTPPLEPGSDYHYKLKARWMENGREVTRAQVVPVEAGKIAVADFSRSGIRATGVEDQTRPADQNRPNDTQKRPVDR